jgi:hypothetical protein
MRQKREHINEKITAVVEITWSGCCKKMHLIQPNKYWELKDVQALNTELNKKYFSLVQLEILLV